MMDVWPASVTKRFVELMQDHTLSYREIAGAISREFNLLITKNAAIGKARRLGLPMRGRKVTLNRKLASKLQHSLAPARVQKIAAKRPFRPTRRRLLIPLLSLAPGQCRYPTNHNVPFVFCGAPQIENSSYCRLHHQLTHYRSQR